MTTKYQWFWWAIAAGHGIFSMWLLGVETQKVIFPLPFGSYLPDWIP
jgi:hypothetical protein